jgi:dihydropteroate synthase
MTANTRPMGILALGGPRLPLNERTLVMGILNLTPDSFSGDGLDDSVEGAVARARQMACDGADIIDIGAESTRPGSEGVSEADELARLEPVIRALRAETEIPISVDTMKPAVAERTIALGADIINDVYGLRAPGMLEVAAATGVPVIIMHMQGQPRDMQVAPHYGDVVTEVRDFLAERIAAATAAGVAEEQIAIDPGFGFGKTVAHNLELLRRLEEFKILGRAVLAGTSRKSTIGKVLGAAPRTAWQGPSAGADVPPAERLWGTAAPCAVAIANGAAIIRVHDVAPMVQVARMTDAILGAANAG